MLAHPGGRVRIRGCPRWCGAAGCGAAGFGDAESGSAGRADVPRTGTPRQGVRANDGTRHQPSHHGGGGGGVTATTLEQAAGCLVDGDPREGLARARARLAMVDIDRDVAAVGDLIVVGRCHQALEQHRAARAVFERACELAVDGGDPSLAAAALGALAGQDRVDGRHDEACQRGSAAVAEALRVGDDGDVLVAMLRSELALTYERLGRLDEAEALHQQAFACLRGTLGPAHPEVAAALRNLARLAHARRDPAAEALARRGLEIRAAALGDDHLAVARDRAALASILESLGRAGEAEQLLRQALACFERTLGPDHVEVAAALHDLAAIDHRLGRLDRAAAGYVRSLDVRARALGDGHPELATTLVELGRLERSRGRLPAARGAFTRAVHLLDAAMPAGHPALASARRELALLQPPAPSRHQARPRAVLRGPTRPPLSPATM